MYAATQFVLLTVVKTTGVMMALLAHCVPHQAQHTVATLFVQQTAQKMDGVMIVTQPLVIAATIFVHQTELKMVGVMITMPTIMALLVQYVP
jgi:hypothetical protein